MTEAQAKRLAAIKRKRSVAGAVERDGVVIVGWERSHDGRDMTTELDAEGRVIITRPTYTYGER